jgi:pyruvate carboxylase subunit B
MDKIYLVEIGEKDYTVTISEGPDGMHVRLGDGPAMVANWSKSQLGVFSLLLDNTSHELAVNPVPDEPSMWSLEIGPYRMDAQVQTERERRLSRVAGAKQAHTGPITVKAPMPGLVRSLTVAVGDEVPTGGRLLLLEAMKMENEIVAPRAGIVKTIHVKPGETVENGRPLVVLE